MIVGLLALTLAAAFTGTALYVSFAEQPARMTLENKWLLAQWKPSYRNGAVMQGGLALISGFLGIVAEIQLANWTWAIGAAVMLANWPYTLIAILPTNHKLNATPIETANDDTRRLIERWARLHLVRGLLGALATALYFAAAAGVKLI